MERRIETEYDDKIEEYHKLQKGGFFVKCKNDEGIDEDQTSIKNRMRSQSEAFTLGNSKHKLNHSALLLDEIETNSLFTCLQVHYVLGTNMVLHFVKQQLLEKS